MIENNRPYTLAIRTDEFPNYFKEFITLSGIAVVNKLPRKYRYYEALNYYDSHKYSDWNKLDIPPFVVDAMSELCNFVALKELMLKGSKGKPIKLLQKSNLIGPFCAEAMIVLHYVHRGYHVSWPSVFNLDPPDIIVRDLTNNFAVDIEVKTKEERGSVETMFDSFSRGLQSLKKRRRVNGMAVIAIHNSDDLGWVDWLKDAAVLTRLESRLRTKDFSIVSGVIFSGGSVIKEEGNSSKHGTKLVAFRSNAAANPLPLGFLTQSANI